MNEKEYLLTVLSEECSEITQRACKALRFGLFEIQPGQLEDNTRRLERELADLMAVVELLGFRIRDEDKAAKIEKLKKYMGYSREMGTLVDDSPKAPVAHCYGSHCHVIERGSAACSCLCSMCKDAKTKDH